MEKETSSETTGSRTREKVAVIIVILLLLCAIIAVIYLFIIKKQDSEVTPVKGKITEVDDFYHAKNGIWKMETTIYLLKEKKFISSDAERKNYLVYTAKPGETVRISQAAGRWKKLEVMEENKLIATGWADAEDAKAEKSVIGNR